MANLVRNDGVRTNTTVPKDQGIALKTVTPAAPGDRQSNIAFQRVNENLGKNPNFAPQETHNPEHGQQLGESLPRQMNGDDARANEPQPFPAQQETEEIDLRQTATKSKASEQGMEMGRGHDKTVVETPRPMNPENRSPTQNPRNEGRGNQEHLPQNHPIVYPADHPNQNNNPKQNQVQQIVNQVLQRNEIFVGNKTLETVIQNKQNAETDKTNAVFHAIENRAIVLLGNGNASNRAQIQQIVREISREYREQIQSNKHSIRTTPGLEVKVFQQLQIIERMLVSVNLLPRHLPDQVADNLQTFSPKEILSGLLLTRGLISGQASSAEIRNLIAFTPPILPKDVSMTALRDVGHLVFNLISDAAAAKSMVNLDLATQKFVRIMIANNELGVLLATIHLASESQLSNGLISRSLALAQIYQLITELIAVGEKALKDVAVGKLPQGEKLGKVFHENDNFESDLLQKNSNSTEGILRNYLEFNPVARNEQSVSAFENSDSARQAQKEFTSSCHDDIESWLRSGNHRLVKEISFEKPLGLVVERNSDSVYTANKVRLVLVRDSSELGWHFLKSFLVK